MSDGSYCFGKAPAEPTLDLSTYGEWEANAGYVGPLPLKFNQADGAPTDWGKLCNDKIGDCTVAAYYHAVQLWTWRARKSFPTFSDALITSVWLRFVRDRYNPTLPVSPTNNPATAGIAEKEFLYFLKNPDIPVSEDGVIPEKELTSFKPITLTAENIKSAINRCGVAYCGFRVPPSWHPPHRWDDVWDYEQPRNSSDEGHSIILTGWDDVGYDLVSWGRTFRMTYRFAELRMDEAWALNYSLWQAVTGQALF